MQCHNRIIFHWAEIRDFWQNPLKPEKARKNMAQWVFSRKTRVFQTLCSLVWKVIGAGDVKHLFRMSLSDGSMLLDIDRSK